MDIGERVIVSLAVPAAEIAKTGQHFAPRLGLADITSLFLTLFLSLAAAAPRAV